MSGIRTECAPVTKVTGDGKFSTLYEQDFSNPVKLTIVDEAKGHVTCPLFDHELCRGTRLCIVQETDTYTTVVIAPTKS